MLDQYLCCPTQTTLGRDVNNQPWFLICLDRHINIWSLFQSYRRRSYSNLSSFSCFLSLNYSSRTCRADDTRLPMSRVVPIPSSRLTPYRVVIILRLIILCFFLQYRTTHPVKNAYPLWLTSVICEIWFAFSWLLDQFPKWCPINRETYLDRLTIRLVFKFMHLLLLSLFFVPT